MVICRQFEQILQKSRIFNIFNDFQCNCVVVTVFFSMTQVLWYRNWTFQWNSLMAFFKVPWHNSLPVYQNDTWSNCVGGFIEDSWHRSGKWNKFHLLWPVKWQKKKYLHTFVYNNNQFLFRHVVTQGKLQFTQPMLSKCIPAARTVNRMKQNCL